jgi:hypothetical protein
MMLIERWLIAAVVGVTVPVVSMAGGFAGHPQNGSGQNSSPANSGNGQNAVPAKAVVDPDSPPPADPQAQAPKKDDDLSPEADAEVERSGSGGQSNVVGSQHSAASGGTVAPTASPSHSAEAPTTQTVRVSDDKVASKPSEVEIRGKYGAETAHLLNLIQDLKTEVDKAGSNTLSLAALRKADEIQRVARDLKVKMKDQGKVAGQP